MLSPTAVQPQSSLAAGISPRWLTGTASATPRGIISGLRSCASGCLPTLARYVCPLRCLLRRRFLSVRALASPAACAHSVARLSLRSALSCRRILTGARLDLRQSARAPAPSKHGRLGKSLVQRKRAPSLRRSCALSRIPPRTVTRASLALRLSNSAARRGRRLRTDRWMRWQACMRITRAARQRLLVIGLESHVRAARADAPIPVSSTVCCACVHRRGDAGLCGCTRVVVLARGVGAGNLGFRASTTTMTRTA